MKKLSFTILFIFLSTFLFAQIKPGIELGFQMTNAIRSRSSIGDTSKLNGNLRPAFKGGVVVDFLIVNNFSIQPSVLYSLYNIQTSTPITFTDALDNSNIGTFDSKERKIIHTVQLPVYIIYKTSIEGRGRFFVGAGVYGSYALGARRKLMEPVLVTDSTQPTFYRVEEFKSKYSLKITNKVAAGNYRPFEFGLGATVGYELPVGVFFRGQMQHALTSSSTMYNTSDNYTRNWSFGVSIGIYFGDGGGGYNW